MRMIRDMKLSEAKAICQEHWNRAETCLGCEFYESPFPTSDDFCSCVFHHCAPCEYNILTKETAAMFKELEAALQSHYDISNEAEKRHTEIKRIMKLIKLGLEHEGEK